MSRKRTWIQVPNSTLTFRIQIIKVDLIFFAHIFVCLTFLFQPTVSQGCATLSGRWIQLQEHIQTAALCASLLPGHRGARWGQSGQPSGQWSPGAGEPAQLKPATFLRGWMNTGAPVVQISSYLCCTHRGVFIVALCTTLSYITAEYWVEHLLFEGICPSVITAEIPLGLPSPIHCSIAAQKKGNQSICVLPPLNLSHAFSVPQVFDEKVLFTEVQQGRGTQADLTPKMYPAISSSKCTGGSVLNIFPLHSKGNLKKSWSTITDNVWFPMLLTMESMVPGG